MKTPSHTFTVSIEPGGNLIISIPPDHTLSIQLNGSRTWPKSKTYSASVEWIHAAVSRKHQRENPTGKPRRRRLLTHSDQMREMGQ